MMKHLSMKTLFAAGLLLTASTPALSQQMMLATDGEVTRQGENTIIKAMIGNDTNANYEIPLVLKADINLGNGETTLVELVLNSEARILEPNEFATVQYTLLIPATIHSDMLQVSVRQLNTVPLYMRVEEGIPPVSVVSSSRDGREQTLESIEENDEGNTQELNIFDGVSTYEPIYFLFGTKPFDSKFQISLKYQLFNPEGRWAQKSSWLSRFYLGYTQLAFWDLSAESKPFEDTNFMPEIFYRAEDVSWSFLPEKGQLDLQVGLLHESNGRGGEDSRSLNMVYGRATYRHDLADDLFIKLRGDYWRYVGDLDDNPDLPDYRGHSSMKLTFGSDDGLQLSAYRRGPLSGKKGSYLFDASLPLKRIGMERNFNFKIHGQLFTGYGENLLTYRQKETRFRFGIGIHR